MAKHQRQVIRENVAALLTGKTAAGARVYKNRVNSWRVALLPAIAVYTLEEPVDAASLASAPRELTRQLKLEVQIAVQLSDAIDDAVDAVCVDVERLMDADDTFSGAAAHSILENTTIGIAPNGDQPVGSAILTYAVTYYTYAPDAADVALHDFATADVKTSLGGTADLAEDVVTLPTG